MGQADVTVHGGREIGLGGDGGKVHHRIGAIQQPAPRLLVAADVGDGHVVRRHDVDAAHLVTNRRQAVRQAPPETSCRPGDDHAHPVMLAPAPHTIQPRPR